jgi:colanic acid/amylovoran biosynthesis glycosyltransferase
MTTVGHIISPYLFHTGSWIYNQLTHIKRFDNVVITHQTQNLGQFPFPKIISLNDLPPLQRKLHQFAAKYTWRHYYFFFKRPVRDFNVGIFYAHFGWEAVFAAPLLRAFSRVPLVVRFYGVDVTVQPKSFFWRKAYQRVFNRASIVLVEGNNMKKNLIKLGCTEGKIKVVHLGIDISEYPFCVRKPPQKNGAIRILHCATFREKKGHQYALRAFAEVKKIYPMLCLRFIGDGPLLTPMKQLAKELQIDNSVEFLGTRTHQETIQELLNAHILLYPSVTAADGDTEGGVPVTIIEALATGMPVISSRHADIPEVVLHGRSGLLAEERNINQLANSLEYLISHSDLWESYGKVGRAHTELEYNLDVQMNLLEDLFENL